MQGNKANVVINKITNMYVQKTAEKTNQIINDVLKEMTTKPALNESEQPIDSYYAYVRETIEKSGSGSMVETIYHYIYGS